MVGSKASLRHQHPHRLLERHRDGANRRLTVALDRAISIVTWMEVMAGATPGEEPRIRAFLATFSSPFPLTPEIAELSVIVRRQRKM